MPVCAPPLPDTAPVGPFLTHPDPAPCPAWPRLKSTQKPRRVVMGRKAPGLSEAPQAPHSHQMNLRAPQGVPSTLLADSGSNPLPRTSGHKQQGQRSSLRPALGPPTPRTQHPSETRTARAAGLQKSPLWATMSLAPSPKEGSPPAFFVLPLPPLPSKAWALFLAPQGGTVSLMGPAGG